MRAFIKSLVPPLILNRIIRPCRLHLAAQRRARRVCPTMIEGGPLRGVTLLLDPQAQTHPELEMRLGTHDSPLFAKIAESKKEPLCIYEVGAHIGYHALGFSNMLGPQAQVLAFEPNATNRARLEANLNLNPELAKRVLLYAYALSDADGESEFIFSDSIDDGRSSGSFLSTASTPQPKDFYLNQSGFMTSRVITKRLDSLVQAGLPAPSIIKLDVEGAEGQVLAGAHETLEKFKPLLLIELHSIASCYSVISQLAAHQYRTEILAEEKDGRIFIAAE